MASLSFLKSLSLAINLSSNDPTLVAHLAPWQDYAWSQTTVCDDATLCTVPPHRWDWHRDQWVNFAFQYQRDLGRVVVSVGFVDDDPTDADFVCVTAVFLDAANKPLLTYHVNQRVEPGDRLSLGAAIPARDRWNEVVSVAVGTKQCRDGAHQDDDVYALALAKLL